ncbi:MAG TPA: SagB/ThcOx family dehydrogenase, partial [Nitrospira sp.]|nr:SagB/ThcOx family dehydrogenase [Nitrospira sp.]
KKAGQSEWALRSNPSSGNLHPTEGYVILPQIEGLGLVSGLYHYAPKEHGLERRAEFQADAVARLMAAFPPKAFLVGLTSVHWREAWKYGERAFRYCNHDVGHAIGAARIAAATLGWNMELLDGMDQDVVAILLGSDRLEDFGEAEPEHPDCLAVVWPTETVRAEELGVSGCEDLNPREVVKADLGEMPLFLDPTIVKEVVGGTWYGKANRLSCEHGVHWEIIDEVAEASWKRACEARRVPLPLPRGTPHPAPLTSHGFSAGQIIHQRRSAVAFDGKTSISAETFFHMLQRVIPWAERSQLERPMPWDVWPYDPGIHLLVFVHRVDGLTPGLYFLVRDSRKLSFVQQAMNAELSWTIVPGCPEGLLLYRLLEGDSKRLAVQVSCHQDIAGDSAFSFGMVAEFEGDLRERGAWWYPRLFWEAGLLGQIMYLEAEAAGVRATGIGCFFDDPVHEIVGIQSLTMQSLYHFTIGGPVEDQRLQMLPPYAHLVRNKG